VPVPLDDRVQQAITGQQRPTPRRLAAFPYPGQRGRREAGRQHLPGRAREAGRKIPDHHTQPGLAPSHYRTRPLRSPAVRSRICGHPIRPGRRCSRDGAAPSPAGQGSDGLARVCCRRGGSRAHCPRPRPPEDSPVLCPDPRSSRLASRRCRVPALAKTFLPGRIRQGPSMYEMEGPCPASPRPLASCLAWPAPRAARRGQIPARGPVSRLLPRSRGRPRVVPVSSGESISTASATTAQGPAASHFLFFRYPRRNPQKAGSYPDFTAVIHGFIHSLPTGYRVEAGEHLNRCRRTKSADRLTATSR
jgi:hypothetical protein